MRKCPWCGTQNVDGTIICRACGITFPGEKLPPKSVPHPSAEPQRPEHGSKRWFLRMFFVVFLVSLLGGGAGLWLWGKHQRQQVRRQVEQEQHKVMAARQRAEEVNAKAKDCLARGDFTLGLTFLDEVLTLVELPHLLETKANLLFAAGRRNEAYEVLCKLLQSRSGEAYLHDLAGNLASSLKRLTNAIGHYQAAAELEAKNSGYRISLASASMKAGQVEQGSSWFEKLIRDDPACVECWYSYGFSLLEIGESVPAIEVQRRAVAQFPNSSKHHFYLARMLDQVGTKSEDKAMLEEAATHYRQSLSLRPLRNSVASARYRAITGKQVSPELEEMLVDMIELEIEGEHEYVRARINGIPGRFLLDTGASSVAIYQSAATKFRVKATSSAKVETANKVVEQEYGYGEVTLGKFKVDGIPIFLMPDTESHQQDGLLGKKVLNKFNWRISTHPDGTRRALFLKGYKPDEPSAEKKEGE